jgi:hypothetical protein
MFGIDTVGELPSAENCASHMPLLTYKNLENPTQQSRLYRVEIGSPTVSGGFWRQCPARCGCKALPSAYCPATSYPSTGLAALPPQPRRLPHNALVTRGIASRDIFTPSIHLGYLAICLTSAPARTLAIGRNVSAPVHVSVRQPQAAVVSQPLTAPPAAGPRPSAGGWPACRWL